MRSSAHQRFGERLREARSGDGGFGFAVAQRTEPEPTAVAALALDDQGARRWLADHQAPDGGFAERGSAAEDCSTATLAALALPDRASALRALDYAVARRAPAIGESGGESGDGREGWGWTPDTHSWVEPTARVLLAARVLRPEDDVVRKEGLRVLRDRQCPDGGWNYGNATVLGVDLRGYAQTTAVALIALHGTRGGMVERGLSLLRARWPREPGGLTLAQALVAFRLHDDAPSAARVEEALAVAFDETGFLGNVLALAWATFATAPDRRLGLLRGAA